MLFVSERITNISDLEKLIMDTELNFWMLEEEIQKIMPPNETIAGLMGIIKGQLEEAGSFEFCLEKRKCNLEDTSESLKATADNMGQDAKFTISSSAVGVSDIAFRLPTPDWERLEGSELWGLVCQFLEGVQKGYSPMYP